MASIKPSDVGRRKYPPDGYAEVEGGAVPCVCVDTCAPDCQGECGCAACERATLDYLHSGTATQDEIDEFQHRRSKR